MSRRDQIHTFHRQSYDGLQEVSIGCVGRANAIRTQTRLFFVEQLPQAQSVLGPTVGGPRRGWNDIDLAIIDERSRITGTLFDGLDRRRAHVVLEMQEG